MSKFTKVAVLMGGGSSESAISLKTGAAVLEGLREAGYDAAGVVAAQDDSFALPAGTEAVFIALHGAFGEDGGAQLALEKLGVPYTGSRPESARVSFDKILSRAAFEAAGVRVPRRIGTGDWGLGTGNAGNGEWGIGNGNIGAARGEVETLPRAAGNFDTTACRLVADMQFSVPSPQSPVPFPLVVKPPRQGSSVGVSIVKRAEDFSAALAEAAKYDSEILVEEFIPGREWTVPILGRQVLPIVEITPKGEWYDDAAKYHSGGSTKYTFPEDDPANAAPAEEARRLALLAFDAVGAWSVGRVDFRVSPDGVPYVLELNSIPGCTASSLLPKSAAKAGISFPELCAAIMEDAR